MRGGGADVAADCRCGRGAPPPPLVLPHVVHDDHDDDHNDDDVVVVFVVILGFDSLDMALYIRNLLLLSVTTFTRTVVERILLLCLFCRALCLPR